MQTEMTNSVIVASTSSCFCLLALILFFDVLSTFDPLVFFVSFVVPAFFKLYPSFLLKGFKLQPVLLIVTLRQIDVFVFLRRIITFPLLGLDLFWMLNKNKKTLKNLMGTIINLIGGVHPSQGKLIFLEDDKMQKASASFPVHFYLFVVPSQMNLPPFITLCTACFCFPASFTLSCLVLLLRL